MPNTLHVLPVVAVMSLTSSVLQVCEAAIPTIIPAPNNGTASQYFGERLEMSGNGSRLAISAWGYNNNRGIVYLYNTTLNAAGVLSLSAPSMCQELTQSDGNAFGFGLAMSTDGSILVVGAAL